MDWLTLADITKQCAALPEALFSERFGAPFLLELNPDDRALEDVNSQTLRLDPSKVESATGADYSPDVDKSRLAHFGAGETFLAGRKEEACDIVVKHPTMSKQHARFEAIGSLWSVTDLGSTNGTFLNGQQLGPNQQTPLKFGSKLVLGEAQFLFLSSDDCYEMIQSLTKEPRLRPRSLAKYKSEFKGAGDAESVLTKFPGPFLVVQAPSGRDAAAPTGDLSGNTVQLSEEELKKSVNKNVADAIFDLSKHTLVRIGRASVTQIHLPLRAISTLQCALIREQDATWSIQDLGGRNGTYVWGKKLSDRETLDSGSEIMLGNIKAIFFNTEDMVTYAVHRDTLV